MKKDKKWLKKEVSENVLEYPVYYDELVTTLIDQLDEPETLSQEWIDENKVARINNLRKMTTSDVVPVEKLKNLLVPKQDKPMIPQFVADWYESEGKRSSWWNWFYKWGRDESRTDLETKAIGWMQDYNEEAFVNVFLYGYTVEEEQKYYVLDKEDATLLKKTAREGVAKSVGTNISSAKSWKDEKKYQLTEQEIKDYDERYIPFMVPVDEVNND